MKPLLADILFRLSGGVRRVENHAALDRNGAVIRPLQKVQAAEQGGFAGTGGADDGQGLTLL